MPKRGGAKVSGCRSGLIAPQFGACTERHFGVGGGAAFLCQATWPPHNRPASVQKRCGSLDLHQRHRMVAS